MDSSRRLGTLMENTMGTRTSPLLIGKWTMVYVSYFRTVKGQGFSKILLDGISEETSFTWVSGASDYSTCTAMSSIKVGNGFIGEIKRIQVYSPAAYRPNTSKKFIQDIGFLINHSSM